MLKLSLPLLKLPPMPRLWRTGRQVSLPKILRVSLLLAVAIFITLLAQSKPPTTYAALCYPGECEPDKYVCGSTFEAADMCCTGGGCPSWVCTQMECTPKSGDSGWGCYGIDCVESPYQCNCKPVSFPCCILYDKWGKCVKWSTCSKTVCETCWECKSLWCGSAYLGGGTCSWCTGVDPGDGGGGGGGCDWNTKPNIAPTACVQANGLFGHYYRDDPAGEPRFDGGLKLERNDAQVNFDWGTGAPDTNLCEDNFSVSWTGFINLPSSGNWRFGATSDDGFAVDLELTPGGGLTPVFSDWTDHATRTAWGEFYNLTAGWYQIRVQYYDNSGGAVAQLLFEGPGASAQIVPSANLRTCSSPCAITAPSGLNATAITATSAQLNWTPGTGGDKQLVRLDDSQTDVQNSCPGGVGPGAGQCLLRNDNVPSGQSTYGTGGILSPETLYYFQVVEYQDAACYQAASSSFTTGANPWVKLSNGTVFGNHQVSLRIAPIGENSRWGIFARGSVVGTSQENWIAQYYPERNFNLNQNTPIQAPSYATLWKRFGQGIAVTYSGPTLPNSSGAYLISGNKTVSGIFNQAAGTNILIFVNGNLTIDAEIRVPATSTLAFIVSGTINFSKSLAGGGGSTDSVGGIYIAQGRINTAYDKSSPDEVTPQLVVEGALISLFDTLSLDRNLDSTENATTPAESIDLSAKYYVLLKSVLGRPKFFWQEVPAGF